MTKMLDSASVRGYRTRHAEVAQAGPRIALPYGLSERELTVLRHVVDGLADLEIAHVLGVTRYTINKHVAAILSKMEVTSRTGAAVRAIKEHIVD